MNIKLVLIIVVLAGAVVFGLSQYKPTPEPTISRDAFNARIAVGPTVVRPITINGVKCIEVFGGSDPSLNGTWQPIRFSKKGTWSPIPSNSAIKRRSTRN